ncbi:hypothetical protein CCHL11_07184 [Colletotrichum chlorophyti]|uniref:Uncharacterized protein n=1 Tax=Colletotrichum chlorophyti TaxID=708187 RepID=A0A1Q8S0J7_9PEZI|nr:hypothetical protein CCHL11_07184 [Colletotrichum chlorophyti]
MRGPCEIMVSQKVSRLFGVFLMDLQTYCPTAALGASSMRGFGWLFDAETRLVQTRVTEAVDA